MISSALINVFKAMQHPLINHNYSNNLPISQLFPVHPEVHLQTFGKMHVPPFRQPP